MPTLGIENALVIVLRVEETRPTIVPAFNSDADSERALAWIATQPALLEIVAAAYRARGTVDDVFDRLAEAAGGKPGDDRAWLDTLAALDPRERRRLLDEPADA